MNEKIQLVFRHYSREHDEALEWLRNNPEAKSILRASTIKKIFRPNGYHGCSCFDFDIAFDKDVKVRGTDGVTETFSYSQIANELLEELKEERQLPTGQTDNSPAYISEEVAESFNYALVSVEIGDYLRGKEQQLKNEYMNFTANCGAIFAEAQERLAGDNQYNGLFEKWIVSMGFSKPTVYRMISVFKFRSSQIETSNGQAFFDALPKTLQADISAPSAPPELVEQVMSGDITTHKEYIELKRQLESTQKELSHTRDDLRNVERNFDEREKLRLKMGKENTELQLKIRELENRPIEVATPDDEDIERMAKERADSLLRDKDNEWRAKCDDLKDKLRQAEQDAFDAAFNSNTQDTEQIKDFYETLHGNALSAIRDCFDFVRSDKIVGSTAEMIRARLRSLKEVVSDYITEMEGKIL